MWLRVRVLNSLVFSFSTTVRAIRDSLREAAHVGTASNFLLPCSESIAVQLRKYCPKMLQQAASRIRLRSSEIDSGGYRSLAACPVSIAPDQGMER